MIGAKTRTRVQLTIDESECATQQNLRDECDINKIVERYARTGVIEHVSAREPRYIDCDALPQDLLAQTETLLAAEEWHASLPAEVRARYPTLGQALDALESGALKLADGDRHTSEPDAEADGETSVDPDASGGPEPVDGGEQPSGARQADPP